MLRSRSISHFGPVLAVLCAGGLVLTLGPARAAVDGDTVTITDERLASGVPLGGIGTGKVDFLTDGSFGNLTLNNNWSRPVSELPASFFAVRTQVPSGRSTKTEARVLALRSAYGFPTVSGVRYQGRFPQAQVRFTQPGLPVAVELQAASSLVPHNLKDSSLPAATFSFTLTNPGKTPVETTLAFSWENVLGCGGNAKGAWRDRTGNVQAIQAADGRIGLVFSSTQKVEGERLASSGQYAVTAEAEGGRVSTLSYWNAGGKGEDFWKSFSGPTLFGEKPTVRPGREGIYHPAGVVAATVAVPAGGSSQVHFTLGWNMPHVPTTSGADLGHAYTNHFKDAWSAAVYASQYRDTLQSGSNEWQDLLLKSSLPVWFKQKLVNDAFPLVSNTLYTKDGKFALLETPSEPDPAFGALDQWLLTRTLLASLFPKLDVEELRLFTQAQAASGEVPRITGTLAGGFGGATTEGTPKAGAEGPGASRPDAACNYILAVLRQYRWTGDADAMKAAYPAVVRALSWLKSQDTDGDGLPEGTTVWQQTDPGTFSYTAGLYLAALRAADVLATANADRKVEAEVREQFRVARNSATAQLWNGRYFARYLDPTTGQRSSNLFVGSLAGEWAAEWLDLPELLDRRQTAVALDSALDLLPQAARILPPNEVHYGGGTGNQPLEAAWAGAMETYLGALGIARRHPDAGMDVVRKVHAAQYWISRRPWDAALAYHPRTAERSGGSSHATTLASWNAYSALTGVTLDEPAGKLGVSPSLPADLNGLHAPLFGPRYWAWIDYARNPNNAATNLRLKLIKKFDDRPVILNALTTAVPVGTNLDDLMVLVSGPGGMAEGKTEVVEGKLQFTFKLPYEWRPNETLEMTVVPPDANNLVLSFSPSRVWSYGSVVSAKELHREREIRFVLVNPTRERQVVNVRFREPSDRNYEVYQNGTKLFRFTPDTPVERLSVLAPASPVRSDRVDRLREAEARLQAAREQANREGKVAALESQVEAVQSKLIAALRADEQARSTQIVLKPVGNRLFRTKVREKPPVVPTSDPEPAVSAAEDALAAAPQQAESIQDERAKALYLGALFPVDLQTAVIGRVEAGQTVRLRVTAKNHSRERVNVAVGLSYPRGWEGPENPPVLTTAPGETEALEIPLVLPADLPTARHPLDGRAILTAKGIAWSQPVRLTLGRAHLRDWSVIGIWEAEQGLGTSLPPDQELDPTKSYGGRRWQDLLSKTDRVDLAAPFEDEGAGVAYAVTQVFSPTDQDATLELGGDGRYLAKVNGAVVMERREPVPAEPATDKAPIRLRQGWNTVVLKLERPKEEKWGFYAEITDKAGLTPSGIRAKPGLAE